MTARHHLRPLSSSLLLAGSFLLAACGGSEPTAPGAVNSAAAAAPRVVEISMQDMRFTPREMQVEAGQAITFRFTNDGAVVHEAFIGRSEDQRDHAEMMKDETMQDETMQDETMKDSTAGEDAHHGHGDGLGGGHNHGSATMKVVVVAPGETGEITHTFTETGVFEIGCHQPGHYEAGMLLMLNVRV